MWGSSSRDLFENEVDILRRLDHPNIIGFHGSLTNAAGKQFLILEYGRAGSLSSLLKMSHRPMQEMHVAYVFKALLSALQHLHSRRIVHRDIKADNITFTQAGCLKLIDFGISARIDVSQRAEPAR